MGFDWLSSVAKPGPDASGAEEARHLDVGVDAVRVRVDPRSAGLRLALGAVVLACGVLIAMPVLAAVFTGHLPAGLAPGLGALLLLGIGALAWAFGWASLTRDVGRGLARWRASRSFAVTAHGVRLADGFVPYDALASAHVGGDRLVFVRRDGSSARSPALDPDERSAVLAFVVPRLEASAADARPIAVAPDLVELRAGAAREGG